MNGLLTAEVFLKTTTLYRIAQRQAHNFHNLYTYIITLMA